eukprot:CAMPEP_0178932190 /NCGR_PEP_ID=MMETSP0786-20121207/22439_1 /TAXON_ID=186022 /ORGANISM="Thalassionema frauenfeldii, Strain CCMP 1798" /LENGTH=303 /DNA_ID=CAMNT_0020609373 /DNA_START=260 /DNA_END=1167 /DNA_ORIENTATION=-
MVSNNNNNNNDDGLGERFGGYTVKQRLREEIESPFRNVRLYFFGVSTASAMLALYFSSLAALKGYMGGFADTPPLEESLQSCAINIGAAATCAFLTYRDYKAGQANLERISKGGALARLRLSPADGTTNSLLTMKEYRRAKRVIIAAGGAEYVSQLALALTSDQRSDDNTLVQALQEADVMIVPVLLENNTGASLNVGNTISSWQATTPTEQDRNFDLTRANSVVAFPNGPNQWYEYLQSEIETCQTQGFDVLEKGFTITVKKNGRILRRATGQPQWNAFLQTMEVMDGSKFGMPGDSEKYGG